MSAVGRLSRPDLPVARLLALGGLAAVMGSFLAVLRSIVNVSGDLTLFYLLAAGAVLAATLLARVLRVALAVVLTLVALAAGLALYLVSLPYDPAVVAMLQSNVELLSGQSLLEIERATVWALSVTPAPVFAIWYLGLRGWYPAAAAVGGGMLGYFVLTTDAGVGLTLLGTVGGAAAVGFGDLARGEGSPGAAETVAVVLAVMVVAPLVISVVPSGAAGAVEFGDSGTVEATLLSTEPRVDITGSVELSPTVRYRVTSAEGRYWRTTSYNRYTGDAWVRSGDPADYDGTLSAPPGQSRRLTQRFRAETEIRTMPAAWRPVEVGAGIANRTEVTADGGLQPAETLSAGTSYEVTSAVPVASPDALAAAGTDDPAELAERYTQLPATMPDRVVRRTENIIANARNRYETARVVERWLETSREYSLEVSDPGGNVADAFLFEMERGYCTYYATTMVTMLRTQDIPARLTVGYTTGEQVDSDRYVVRGYNSHAWVEVYFPDVGWVRFDPTPAQPRVAAEQARLDEARSTGTGGVDTNRTGPNATDTPAPLPTPVGATPVAPPNVSGANASTPTPTPAPEGVSLPSLPSTDRLALGAVVVAGAVAGLRRSGLFGRAYRWVWLRRHPRVDPATDIERAYRQAIYLLERRHRPRRSGETVRDYLEDVGAGRAARRVAQLRERARYGAEATEAMADEAIELAERLRRR